MRETSRWLIEQRKQAMGGAEKHPSSLKPQSRGSGGKGESLSEHETPIVWQNHAYWDYTPGKHIGAICHQVKTGLLVHNSLWPLELISHLLPPDGYLPHQKKYVTNLKDE
ncbi:hypothetical protein TNCT_247521 [Trichonephila clavata]|uniref:Uncharacterized protein n=1 Tax=Trichonephila clavata TaxID=2740835 RepID=A0A8X6KB81_TRICU|nr:hypothetical protein TNCT_247521 [Trichonephila clavata]